jgi:hypothetical protein
MKLTIEVEPKALKFQELYQTLQALLPGIRKEKGCQDCQMEDGDIFSLVVSWDQQANLEHYLRSNNGAALIGAIDMLGVTSSVKIGEALWPGIEILKIMRKE